MHAGRLDRDALVARLGAVCEASPWAAEAAAQQRSHDMGAKR
jgi:2-oxo-4-hydroxy-4-carboxy--5-ureidoimidazoline (OHCU) decarboxylase